METLLPCTPMKSPVFGLVVGMHFFFGFIFLSILNLVAIGLIPRWFVSSFPLYPFEFKSPNFYVSCCNVIFCFVSLVLLLR